MDSLKVIIVGGLACGKTCLLERFALDKFTHSANRSTLGASYMTKQIVTHGQKLPMGIWDTCGQERFRAMMRMFFRDAKAAIICYDITSQESWADMKSWICDVRNHEEDCKLYICGCKKDVADVFVEERKIKFDFASSYAKAINVDFFETSSKTGENVDLLFQKIADDYWVRETAFEKRKTYTAITLKKDNNETKRGCRC